MKIHLVNLDPKLPAEGKPGAAGLLVPMTPGIYTVKLLDWYEGKTRRVSAWHAWGGVFKKGVHGWTNYFYAARWTGQNVDTATKQLVGLPRPNVFEEAEQAFNAFPHAEARLEVPKGRGAVVPMLLWLTSDYVNDLGEMRIELQLKS